jgi:hypothetical protein
VLPQVMVASEARSLTFTGVMDGSLGWGVKARVRRSEASDLGIAAEWAMLQKARMALVVARDKRIFGWKRICAVKE